ncbi:hypothetical protein ACO0LB_17895 [Undibacterium sp. SXout7W]|uniref:hypothetical protein n=1 Tax=Undibacterium sp. SXout7W TaxID=3413049 RepID=UPI003BF21639
MQSKYGEGISSREVAKHLNRLALFLDAEAARYRGLGFIEDNEQQAKAIEKEAADVRDLALELHDMKETIGKPVIS